MSANAQSTSQEWEVFRGRSDLSGFTFVEIPEKPALLWSYSSGSRTKSSPVVSNGLIFFGIDKGSVIAVRTDGKRKWEYSAGSAAEAPPLIFNNKVIGECQALTYSVRREKAQLESVFGRARRLLTSILQATGASLNVAQIREALT